MFDNWHMHMQDFRSQGPTHMFVTCNQYQALPSPTPKNLGVFNDDHTDFFSQVDFEMFITMHVWMGFSGRKLELKFELQLKLELKLEQQEFS